MQMFGDVRPAQIGKLGPQSPSGWIARVACCSSEGYPVPALFVAPHPTAIALPPVGFTVERAMAGAVVGAARSTTAMSPGNGSEFTKSGCVIIVRTARCWPPAGREIGLTGHHDEPGRAVHHAVRGGEDGVRRDHRTAARLPVGVARGARHDECGHERVGTGRRGRTADDARRDAGMGEGRKHECQRGEKGDQSQAHGKPGAKIRQIARELLARLTRSGASSPSARPSGRSPRPTGGRSPGPIRAA